MNCIVTAGPTYESLDQVRRLTNMSTGTLGVELSQHLASRAHQVTLLKGYYAVTRSETTAHTIVFTTTTDLRDRLKLLASPNVGAVFHAAAVSDFAFGRVFRRTDSGALVELQGGKFSTRDGCLMAELVPTVKIIVELREWFPHALIYGWKYEVDGTRDDALRAGQAQMIQCRTDACVVNGPAYGEGFGLLTREGVCRHLPDRTALFDALTPA